MSACFSSYCEYRPGFATPYPAVDVTVQIQHSVERQRRKKEVGSRVITQERLATTLNYFANKNHTALSVSRHMQIRLWIAKRLTSSGHSGIWPPNGVWCITSKLLST